MGSNTKLFSGLFLVVLAIKVFDVFKNLLIAAFLGVSDNADIYNSLISIPDSLIVLFGLDTIRGVVNSEYSHYYGRGADARLNESFTNILNILFRTGLVLTILVMIFSPLLINLLLPGFTGEKRYLAVSVSYIIFPVLFFKIISGYSNSVLNSLKHFYLPAASPAIISVLLVISVFIPFYKNEIIYNLSFANLAGNVILFAVFAWSLSSIGAKFRLGRIKLDEITRKVLRGSASVLLLVVCNQIYLFSKNYYASYFGEGAISALHYSGTVPSVIISIIFATFFTALISNLSTLLSGNDEESASRLYTKTISALFVVIVPLAVFFLLCGEQLLSVLYLRGRFDAEGLQMTLRPYNWDVLSLLSFVLYIIPTACFLAGKRYKLLTLTGSIVYILGTLLSYFLASGIGFHGVAVSNFIVTSVYGIVLVALSLKLGLMKFSFLKDALIALAGGFITWLALSGMSFRFLSQADATLVRSLSELAVCFLVTFTVYFVIMLIANRSFITEMLNYFRKRNETYK